MQRFKRNPIPFIYGGIVLLLLVGTIALRPHKMPEQATLPSTQDTTIAFSEMSNQFRQILTTPQWLERRAETKTIWLKENLKVVIPDASSSGMILIAYLLDEKTGSKLPEEMAEWTLLTGCIDTAAMNWVADECIPTLATSKETHINGLRCNYSIIAEDDAFWCVLAFRPTEAPIPKLRSQLSAQPSEAIRMDVKKRVESSMRRSGYFRISSR